MSILPYCTVLPNKGEVKLDAVQVLSRYILQNHKFEQFKEDRKTKDRQGLLARIFGNKDNQAYQYSYFFKDVILSVLL